jgi:GAF domain-containing protein
VRGSLYVTDRADGKPFDDDDERLLLTLGQHASHVIDRDWY